MGNEIVLMVVTRKIVVCVCTIRLQYFSNVGVSIMMIVDPDVSFKEIEYL